MGFFDFWKRFFDFDIVGDFSNAFAGSPPSEGPFVQTGELPYYRLRRTPSILNLVVFSGAKLVSAVSSYSTDGDHWIENPYFEKAEEAILARSAHGADFQDEAGSRLVYVRTSQSG